MSFSGTTFEQREKETKALKGFLVLSLIGSLGFHVAVLASGMGNYFSRVSPVEEEPIEIAVLDTPEEKKVEVQPTPEQSPQKIEVQEKTELLTSSKSNPQSETIVKPENPVTPVTLPAKVELAPISKPTFQPKQPVAQEQPIQKLVENLRKPIEPAKPLDKSVPLSNDNSSNSSNNLRETLRGIRDSNSSSSVATSNISGSTTPGNGTPGGGSGGGTSVLTGNGTGSIGGSGSGIGTGNGSGVGSGNGSGIGTGNGSGVGSGNGTSSGNGGERIATASTTPKLPSNGDGRAACQECNIKYSERARRRKAEGRVNVAVDTDSNGNVTNVRLVGSSGDRDLDEEHLRQARNWKLKPSESGRQGVKIATEYAIEGSRRHSQVRKQQQERERQRQREITAASSNNNSSEETPRRRRLIEAAVNGGSDVPVTSTGESRISRRLRRSTAASSANTTEATPTRVRHSERENSLSNRLRRRQREISADVRTSGETPQRLSRRRRREMKPSLQPLDNASRLRNALRRSTESAPVAAPSPSSSQ
jgi:TonB family protein